jgi:hypothetical protein
MKTFYQPNKEPELMNNYTLWRIILLKVEVEVNIMDLNTLVEVKLGLVLKIKLLAYLLNKKLC